MSANNDAAKIRKPRVETGICSNKKLKEVGQSRSLVFGKMKGQMLENKGMEPNFDQAWQPD